MAKQNKVSRLKTQPSHKARGRTATITGDDTVIGNKGALQLEKVTEVSRSTGKSNQRGGKNRGNRRDTSPTYTGNVKHAARGNTPRRDVKTRKR